MTEKILKVPIERYVLETTRDFADVLADIYSGISRPDIDALFKKLATTPTYSEFAGLVKSAAGSAGLMRFIQLNLDDAVALATDGTVARRLVRIIAGNPVTMAKMATLVTLALTRRSQS
jgi:hypothetical protein